MCAETIGTVEECRSADVGAAVGGKSFQSEENESKYPKGCYVGYSSGHDPIGIWWNNHPSGKSGNHRQICKGDIRGNERPMVNV